jgi:hypothetical protein
MQREKRPGTRLHPPPAAETVCCPAGLTTFNRETKLTLGIVLPAERKAAAFVLAASARRRQQ